MIARLAGMKKGIALATLSFGVGAGVGLFATRVLPSASSENAEAPAQPVRFGQNMTEAAAENRWEEASPAAAEAEPKTDSIASETGDAVELSVSTSLESTLMRGESLLLEGNASAAVIQFKNAITLCDGIARNPIIYRLAVCQESLGDLENALDNYRTLASRAAETRTHECALLGQARVWILADRQSLAKPFLCELLINSNSHRPGTESDVFKDALHLLGFTFARDCASKQSRPLIDGQSVVAPKPPFQASHVLGLFGQVSEPREEDVSDGPITVHHKRGHTPEEIELTAKMGRNSIHDTFEKLSVETGLPVTLSPSAELAFRGRTAEISMSQVTLSRLLDLLLVPLDAVWQSEEGALHIRLLEELPPRELELMKVALARRTLQLAVSTFPENPVADHAYLALGNIAFGRGEFQAAAKLYQQIMRQYPRSRLKASASFNRAKSLLQTGDVKEAKEALLLVIDSGYGHRIEAAAYVHLAGLALDEGQLQECTRFARRAIAMASDRDTSSTAPLILSLAYLQKNQPIVANGVLMENRSAVRRPPYRDRAAFLSALARFRTAKSQSRIGIAGRALVSALSNLRPDEFFTASEYLLVAETYEQLQLIDEARRLCEIALEDSLPTMSRDRITFALADYHVRQEQVEKAKPLLAQLALSQNRDVATNATKKLAEVAFAQNKEDDCLRYCQNLLRIVNNHTELSTVLRLMGQVYEQRGDFHNAAVCFAGMTPNLVPPTSLERKASD